MGIFAMQTDKKTFAVRDVSRALLAFGILIVVLNFNQYWLVYVFGIITLIMGVINLFTLNLKVKFAGALNMAVAGIYFIIFAVLLYPDIFGLLGELIITALGLVLLVLSIRFIIYYLGIKEKLRF
jgi:hypothetical protein